MPQNPIRVTFHVRGVDVAILNMRRVRKALVKRCGSTTYNAAQHLKGRSQRVVPYLTGELYDAAYIAPVAYTEDKQVWAVGYDVGKAPHAILVHELPGRLHPIRGPHSDPKQDHYLSEPADQMKKEFPRTVKDDLQDELTRVPITRLARGR